MDVEDEEACPRPSVARSRSDDARSARRTISTMNDQRNDNDNDDGMTPHPFEVPSALTECVNNNHELAAVELTCLAHGCTERRLLRSRSLYASETLLNMFYLRGGRYF